MSQAKISEVLRYTLALYMLLPIPYMGRLIISLLMVVFKLNDIVLKILEIKYGNKELIYMSVKIVVPDILCTFAYSKIDLSVFLTPVRIFWYTIGKQIRKFTSIGILSDLNQISAINIIATIGIVLIIIMYGFVKCSKFLLIPDINPNIYPAINEIANPIIVLVIVASNIFTKLSEAIILPISIIVFLIDGIITSWFSNLYSICQIRRSVAKDNIVIILFSNMFFFID
jgi:hypothetical protein